MGELREMLIDQLRDAFSAEKQLIACLKKASKNITEPMLKEGTQGHVAQSEEHRGRVEQALAALGSKTDRTVCEAMRGLVEEAQNEMGDQDGKGPIMDLVIVASSQRIEHYEIAAYGTMIEIAKALGEQEVVGLLEQTLAEEKEQDLKLTDVTRSAILPAAMEDEGEDEDDEEEKPAAKPAPKKAARAK